MPDQPATTFISYARPHEGLARRLYNDLTSAGVRPWMDRYDIPPGAVWDDAIQQGLETCSHVLILLAQAAVESRNVHAEWNYADSRGKTLLPLICEPLDPKQIPYRLHTANWVNLAEMDYDAALKNLLHVLPITAPPNPLAAPDPLAPVQTPLTGDPDPVAASAAWKHGNAEFHNGDLDAAMHAYTDAIRLAPDRAEANIHRGMVLYSLKRYHDALADFTQAQQRNPDIALLYNNRGVTQLALKNMAQALTDLTEAILLDPGYSNAHYNLAAVFMAAGRFRLATHYYTRAIEINDRVPLYFNSRGMSYAAQKRYDEALADYNRALALDDGYIGAVGNRANAYANLGRTPEALADYDRVIALNPEHHLAYAGRSELRFCAGDYARAALDASTVIGLQPDFHGGYALRALANFRRDQRDQAVADYAQAIKLDAAWQSPDQAAVYLTICPDDALQTLRDLLASTGLVD
jgi:tetratricopeptide (TPR) repeat protein